MARTVRPSSLALLATVVVAAALALTVGALRWGPDTDVPRTPSAAPLQDGGDTGYALWDRRADGTAVRWSPCDSIDWVLSAGAPDGAADVVRRAFDRVTAVTGQTTTFLGVTDETASAARTPFQPQRYGDRWAPVLIAWAPPHAGGLPLRDSDRAISVPVAVEDVFVTGQIVLNLEQSLSWDLADREGSWGATLVHEIGHLVGLDHVDDPAQLMYRFSGSGPVHFGSGDLAGLAAVGTAAGAGTCLDAGAPRSVEVTVAERR